MIRDFIFILRCQISESGIVNLIAIDMVSVQNHDLVTRHKENTAMVATELRIVKLKSVINKVYVPLIVCNLMDEE